MESLTGSIAQTSTAMTRIDEAASQIRELVQAASGVAAVRESSAVIRRSAQENQARVQELRAAVLLLQERTQEVRSHISTFHVV